jgi:outer membrane protein
MRKLYKIQVLFVLFVFTNYAYSQTVKFGHIDLGALIQIMPERIQAEKEYNDFEKELQEVLDGMQQEYNTKLMQLEQFNNNPSEVKRNAKLNELQSIQKRIEKFQLTAQQQASKKYQDLLKPIFDKANKAIEEVALKQGLVYVFDSGTDFLMYKSQKSVDIFPMVKKQLGIE